MAHSCIVRCFAYISVYTPYLSQYIFMYGFKNYRFIPHLLWRFLRELLNRFPYEKDVYNDPKGLKKKLSQLLNTGFSCFIERSGGNLIGRLSWTIVPKRKCKKPEIRWEGKYQQRLNHFMDTVILCVVWNKHCCTRIKRRRLFQSRKQVATNLSISSSRGVTIHRTVDASR